MTEKENAIDMPSIQWFPGHMSKAKRLVIDNLKLVDVVIELLDARIPYSSANPMLREIISGKPQLIVLNKADLADPKITRQWIDSFKEKKLSAVAMDSLTGKGVKQIVRLAEDLASYKTQRLVSKGAAARAARVMILGIPNVGKSSLINRLAGGAKAKTADKPGVTRAKQWIRLSKGLELLDMPGILWPKFDDPQVGLHLAFTGAINDEIYNREQVTALLVDELRSLYPGVLGNRFHIDEQTLDGAGAVLEAIGRKRGCLIKGGDIDMEKAERILLTEFRAGKLGTISLEQPDKNRNRQ